MKIIKMSSVAINEVMSALKIGDIVICPTDTVYGFLADAKNKKAVERIFKIKKRPKSKPLSLFVKDLKMAQSIAFIDKKQLKILKKGWPGKYTFILKRKPNIKLYGVDKKTIAVRIPNYRFLNSLLKKINRPLVQTSVNISGGEPLNNAGAILKAFKKTNMAGIIIDAGSLKNAKPSKIIDITSSNHNILRH